MRANRKSFGMFQKAAKSEVMSPLSLELGNATQQVPGEPIPSEGERSTVPTKITNIFAFQGLGGFVLVVHMAFPGGPVGDMVLNHLEGKAGGRGIETVAPKEQDIPG